jgi:hypothetical protein
MCFLQKLTVNVSLTVLSKSPVPGFCKADVLQIVRLNFNLNFVMLKQAASKVNAFVLSKQSVEHNNSPCLLCNGFREESIRTSLYKGGTEAYCDGCI